MEEVSLAGFAPGKTLYAGNMEGDTWLQVCILMYIFYIYIFVCVCVIHTSIHLSIIFTHT